MLDTEFKFAELRNDIRDGAPIAAMRATPPTCATACWTSTASSRRKGVAAPPIAFGFSFSILFREGVEAVLLLAILLGSLAAGSARTTSGRSRYGVAAALVATAITWLLTTLVIDIAPVNRELLEAVTALLAVVVLLVGELLAGLAARAPPPDGFMRARVASAMAAGTTVAFAGLGFTAVFREGFETVLFYQALALFAQGLGLWVWLGAVAAAVALGAVAYAILGLGRGCRSSRC